jgi:hypothetical protein
MSDNFDAHVRTALRNSHSSSRNLSAFALDLDHYLEQTGLVSRIVIKKTGQAERSLLVTCQILEATTSQSKVIETLKQIWTEAPLGYGGKYDSYEVQQNGDAVQMDFVTVSSDGVSVTGSIIITGFELRQG